MDTARQPPHVKLVVTGRPKRGNGKQRGPFGPLGAGFMLRRLLPTKSQATLHAAGVLMAGAKHLAATT